MLRFYRKIRQKLLEEGRFKKYVAYAVGEILLIVVGIFIALQLNNWNAYRIERQSEYAYYCKLLEDVIQDSIHLTQLMVENEERIHFANQMLSLMQQNKPDRREVVRAMRGAISKVTFTFKPTIAAFDDLKSSGNLKILMDTRVKNSMINYYSTIEGYVDVIDVNSDVAVATYYDKANFAEVGWQHIDFIKNSIDTNLVDVALLDTEPYPTEFHRTQMMSDAILFIGTNARIKSLYTTVKEEILKQIQILKMKCEDIPGGNSPPSPPFE